MKEADVADVTEELKDKVSQDGDGGGSRLSKDKLMPALATAAAAAAAGLVATKGPDLLRKVTGQADDQAEELGGKAAEGAKKQLGQNGGLMGKAASKLVGGGGGGGGQKGGKTRRLPIQRWTDVAVPVNKAYEAWTQFEEFPKFMHRVLEVSEEDENKIHWREKIWFSTREWDGEITDQRKNDRIAWKSVSGTQHSGVISFHKLDSNLTRVLVSVDFVPSGMLEKMASGLRFAKRAVEADLARFKAYVELGDAEGLEYKSKPAEMEQHRDDDGDDDQQQDDDKQDGGDRQEAESRGDDDSGDEDRDRSGEREERESRREERRKAMASS
jgi:uncharacterized membrane protein